MYICVYQSEGQMREQLVMYVTQCYYYYCCYYYSAGTAVNIDCTANI